MGMTPVNDAILLFLLFILGDGVGNFGKSSSDFRSKTGVLSPLASDTWPDHRKRGLNTGGDGDGEMELMARWS